MPYSRYDNREILLNDNERYEKIREKRKITKLLQYNTPKMSRLSTKDHINITTVPHIWKLGDRYYKLSYQYYGDSEYWWLIAWFNQKPTEAHLGIGDPIYIPIPLDDALYYYNKVE